MARKYLFLDFEYNQASERYPNLVCVSWSINGLPVENAWLYHDLKKQKQIATKFEGLHSEGYIFVAYAVNAETRCLQALGMDPTKIRWIDLFLEWRQLQNCNNKFLYGTYFTLGTRYTSVPPVWGNTRQDNSQVGIGLVDCIAYWFSVDVSRNLKDSMRDLILECKPEYSLQEQKKILDYCDSDIKYLPMLRTKLTENLWRELGKPNIENFYLWQSNRSHFAVLSGIMESEGLPLDIEAITNLRRNVNLAKQKLITDLVINHYPFFIRKKKAKSGLIGSWVKDRNKFIEYIETHPDTKHIRKKWKKTSSGEYSADDQYLKTFDNIPALKALRETNKLLNQLKWLRVPEKGESDLFDNIGSDHRIRTHFGIYGTQTARNAPAAKRFIFAMSAWLRCLIKPPKGYLVVELDYASQEFAIAAVLSGDTNMIEAYNSGDPYLFFAKKAKAVPPNGTKKEYKKERDLFKATCLGLQYGMGATNLAIKLSVDTGRLVEESEAKKLVGYHKKVFFKYWAWLNTLDIKYKHKGFLQLPCGWALFKDNTSTLSVRNFPTQGGGSSILREATAMLQVLNIKTIALLHDGIYIEVPDNPEGQKQIKGATASLKNAFNSVLLQKQIQIRIDVSIHKHEEVWVSEKGEKFYHLLKTYLLPQITKEDKINELMRTVFNNPVNK